MRGKVVLFGDSITERGFTEAAGWGTRLQALYNRKMDILCRGYGGYNTRWARLIAPAIFDNGDVKDGRWALATIFFGANDAATEMEKVHVPLDEYRANLAEIVALARRNTDVVLLISPPPVDEQRRLSYQLEKYGEKASGVLERTNEAAGRYAAVARKVAASERVPVLDLWTTMQNEEGWQRFLSDGLHLSPEGQAFVFDRVAEIAAAVSPALNPANIDYDYPSHVEIDQANPAAALLKKKAQM